MSYKINYTYPLSAELKRIATERIDDSLYFLDHREEDLDKTVHELRKNMKKIRAVLRLIRKSIGETQFKKFNALYRDLARRFAPMRDAKVHTETIRSLWDDEQVPPVAYETFNLLKANYQHTRLKYIAATDLYAASGELLRDSAMQLNDLIPETNDFSLVHDGLKKVYRRGRKGLRKARQDTNGQQFHEWRKRVKYLKYQTKLLQNIWPEVLKGQRKSLDQLSDYLGDEHDLFVLNTVNENTERIETVSNTSRMEIARLIDSRRSELHARTWPLGEKLYVEKPSKFTGRIAHYWRIANHVEPVLV